MRVGIIAYQLTLSPMEIIYIEGRGERKLKP